MNLLVTLLLVLLSISCVENNPKNNVAVESIHTENSSIKKHQFDIDKPYLVTLKINKTNNNEFSLITLVDIYDKEFLSGPHSNGFFVGDFAISLEETNNITIKDPIVKSPKPIETTDPWGDGQVNWIKRNTTYSQKFTINSTQDFKVTGYINFEMEPKKSIENTKFIISQNDGTLSVEKITTTIPFTK
jgi:hypothetical protein